MDDNIFITYQRRSNNNYQIKFRKSIDGGYTFSEPKIITEWGIPTVVASNPFLIYKPEFGICLIWSNGDYNKPMTYFIRSKDLGSNFDSIIVVNTNSSHTNANYLLLNKARLYLKMG